MKKLRGENNIEATIQPLNRITLDEGRATTAQTLEVVCGLVRHRKAIMDGNNPTYSDLPMFFSKHLYSQMQTGVNQQLVSLLL